ncbi:MAG: hypothetical protein IIA49_03880 [Bacteroidetes bacterium]|nr:hypothetical protein [Bacteroidota bacterium]
MSYLKKLKELIGDDAFKKVEKDLGDKDLIILNDGDYIPKKTFNDKLEELKTLKADEDWYSNQESIEYRIAASQLEMHSDIKYDPILQVIPKYFCKSKDKETIQLFFEAMRTDRGSANEMPSFTIGDCFVCAPDLIIGLLQQPNNQYKKQDIINHIEWGLINRFSINESAEPTNQEYLNLKKKLEKIK